MPAESRRAPMPALTWACSLAGHLYFLIITVLAILFYPERAFYVDAAHHLFTMINTKHFAIPHLRYSVVFYQWLPLLAIRMNWNIKIVALLFSVAPVLWCYLGFLYARYFLKDTPAAIAIVLVGCLLTRESFYCVYEIPPVLVFLPLLFAHLCRLNSTFAQSMVIATLLFAASLFVHLTVMMAAGFVVAYWVVSQNSIQLTKKAIVVLWFLVIGLVRFLAFPPNQYEEAILPNIQTILERLNTVWNSPVTLLFRHLLWTSFLIFSLSFVLVVILFIIKKRWLELTCVIGFLVAYVAALHVTLPGIGTSSLQEYHYLPVGIVVAVPLASFLLLDERTGKFATYFIFVGIVISLFQIQEWHAHYQKILAYKKKLSSYASMLPVKKIFWDAGNVNRKYIELEWAFPEETLLLSAFQEHPAATISIVDPENNPESGLQTSSFVMYFGKNRNLENQQYFNKRYFNLQESLYSWLNTDASEADLQRLRSSHQVRIDVVRRNSDSTLDVRITSPKQPLRSGAATSPNRTYIWYRRSGCNTKAVHRFTPLEVDVYQEYVQEISVPLPDPRADCNIDVDLYTGTIGRWHAGQR